MKNIKYSYGGLSSNLLDSGFILYPDFWLIVKRLCHRKRKIKIKKRERPLPLSVFSKIGNPRYPS